MSDIVACLRARAHHHFLNTVTHDLFSEAADEIEQLREQIVLGKEQCRILCLQIVELKAALRRCSTDTVNPEK